MVTSRKSGQNTTGTHNLYVRLCSLLARRPTRNIFAALFTPLDKEKCLFCSGLNNYMTAMMSLLSALDDGTLISVNATNKLKHRKVFECVAFGMLR